MKQPIPPRLHVLLSREGTGAVVIRRGPSRFTCTYGWNRQDDSFVLGQWLRGRIYERRCDLSPDGQHLIYFAMNGRWESETAGSFTAVSRAPYLKVVDVGSGRTLEFPDWEWADLDRQRLVWTEAGKLQAAQLGPSGPTQVEVLRDFAQDVPARTPAPY
jgi:hypothetical protein